MKTKFAFLILATFLFSACAAKKAKTVEESPFNEPTATESKKDQTYGPAPMFGPEEPPKKIEAVSGKGYLLVLGPGLARTFSYIGILKELEKDEVEIGAVYGVEFGAVIGSIFADSNANKVEWELYKLKKNDLFEKSMFGINRESSSGKKIEALLEKLFSKKLLEQSKKPLLIGLGANGSGKNKFSLVTKGEIKQAVRASMGLPGVMKTSAINGVTAFSGAMYDPIPVKKLKEIYSMKVLCVDALGTGDDFKANDQDDEYLSSLMKAVSSLAREGFSECDELISVDVNGIHYLDFESRADLIERGVEAARKYLDRR